MIGSLYIIRNNVNNKVYIGKTYQTIEERFNEHLKDAFRKERPSYKYKFYNAIRKYGPEHFYVELIDKFEEGVLEQKEIEYIAKYDSYHNGYNSTLGGDGKRILELDENLIIKTWKETKSIIKTAKFLEISSSTVTECLVNLGLYTKGSPQKRIDVIVYDLNWNRIAILKGRKEQKDFIKSLGMGLPYSYPKRIEKACENSSKCFDSYWQKPEDVLYDGKEFNTVYDKEQYIAGEKCIKINGLWFAKRPNFTLDIKLGKLCVSNEYIKIKDKDVPKRKLQRLAETMSVQQIAEKYHISSSNMYEKLINANIKTQIMANGYPTKRPSKEELEKVKHLPKTQIAKMFGVSDKTIKNWFDKYDITDGYKQKFDIPPKEELEKMLHMTYNEIGKVYKVSCRTVSNWIRFYELKPKRIKS